MVVTALGLEDATARCKCSGIPSYHRENPANLFFIFYFFADIYQLCFKHNV